MIGRRSLLKFAGLAPLISAVPRLAWAAGEAATETTDYTLRIASGLVRPTTSSPPLSITGNFRDRCCA